MQRTASHALKRLAIVAVGLAILLPVGLAALYWGEPSRPVTVSATRVPPVARARAPSAAPDRTAVVPAPLPAATPVAAKVASVIARPDRFDYGAWLWNGDAAGDSASVGPVVVTVDVRAQLLRVWRGGHEIGVSTILYGAPDSPTPLGTFPITQKDADHVSNIFHSPMPYSLRLTNDGVMVHGSNVRAGWASNGCVGVPNDFARRLFEIVKLGDKVVITDGKPLLRVGDALPVV